MLGWLGHLTIVNNRYPRLNLSLNDGIDRSINFRRESLAIDGNTIRFRKH